MAGKKDASREPWTIPCGTGKLQMDFRKCGVIPYFVVRNNLCIAIKINTKIEILNCYLPCPTHLNYLFHSLCCWLFLPNASSGFHEWNKIITKIHPREYFPQPFLCFGFSVFCYWGPHLQMKTEGNCCLGITSECCEPFRSKFDTLSCLILSRESFPIRDASKINLYILRLFETNVD